ncbi:hypothetical protein Trydic_g20764 [Trypoxylus dichotomus]
MFNASNFLIEQNHLRNQSAILVEENKALSNFIKTQLRNGENGQPKHRYDENDVVQNLKSQIQLLVKAIFIPKNLFTGIISIEFQEKESTTELWRNSLETIDHLEDELRVYEGRTHGYVSKTDVKKLKEDYKKQIKELETELIQTKVSLLESQKSTKSIIDLKINELKQLNESHQETSKAVQNLQSKVEQLQLENQNLQTDNSRLTSALKEKGKVISTLKIKEKESQMKVNEAIQIVEAALVEKDAALFREKQAKDETAHLTKALSESVEEANKKAQVELDLAKRQYIEKAQKLKADMKNLTEFLKQKDFELEKEKNAAKVLEEKLDIMQKGNVSIETSSTSKLLLLEKNLETTFQKLLFSEKKNIQLEAENKSIKDDLEQMANMYNRDIISRETEKVVMENKIGALQKDLDISNSNLVQVASKMEEVNSKLLLIETDLQKQLHLKDVKNEKILSNKIKEIEIANSKLNSNIKKRLVAQIQFNKKWKATMNDIIQKLEKRVHDLKQESHTLRQSKKELRQKLRESEEQLNEYKERLKSLCLDVTKIASFSKEHLTDSSVKFVDNVDNAVS